MSFDLRPDTSTLAPTRMRRGDVIDAELWLPPDLFDVSAWVCQVRTSTEATEVAATWAVAEATYGFDDKTDAEQADLTAAGVDDTYVAVLITCDATDLLGSYVWDVQDGPAGNTLFGAPLEVQGDVTRV